MEKRGSSIIALIAPAVVIIPESLSSTELNYKLSRLPLAPFISIPPDFGLMNLNCISIPFSKG
jgi:hypothetical protein